MANRASFRRARLTGLQKVIIRRRKISVDFSRSRLHIIGRWAPYCMDPVSAIGLVGSVVGIVDVAAKSIRTLRELQERWKLTDLTIKLLIAQYDILRVVLDQTSDWIGISTANEPQNIQLVLRLTEAIDSSNIILGHVYEQISSLRDYGRDGALTFSKKRKLLSEEKMIKECLSLVTNQVGAFHLLLTVATAW